jgi:hypothetical protein
LLITQRDRRDGGAGIATVRATGSSRTGTGKSRILARIFPETIRLEEHLALFVAIVDASRRHAQAAWPTAPFHVLLWEDTFGDQQLATVLRSLGRKDISIHLVGDILPPLPEGESYEIANDGHPNGRAHRALAEFVVAEILPESP